MAAHLKKRALAEFSSMSQTITISPAAEPSAIPGTSASSSSSATGLQPPAPKKLKLIKNPSFVDERRLESYTNLETEINQLDSGTRTSGEMFRVLSGITTCLPTTRQLETLLCKKLISLFQTDKDPTLRSKCLAMLEMLRYTETGVLEMIDELIRLISKESVPLVVLSGLTVTLKLLKSVSAPQLDSRLVAIAKKFIKTPDAKVKSKCLEIIGTCLSFEDPSLVADTAQFVHAYSHSHDPRVRSMAFKTMLVLHEKGAKLDLSAYFEVIKYLDDDYESVKLAATQLLWTLSQTYPEELIPARDGGEPVRLIDDAFGKICTSINDPFVQVRVLAAQLLGKMPQVSKGFLEQTLDKKLMSDMRRKRSAHERQREKVKAGEWSSGNQWADDAPKEVIDADSVSLICSGAAGAFVHGLEDEYLEVRSAALDSLCTLAIKNKEFATLALDFLVDMFNDEIEEVRLKAIDCLIKISEFISLWEDQLEIILAAIEDTSIDIREGLHKLLAKCTLMTKSCVKICLDNLLHNLKKYPLDKKSIWKCLAGIGRNHPWVVLPLVPTLLSQHPFFDTPETDPEDPAYVAVLILVLNGAKNCPTMKTLFDEKVVRHYHYLRDTLPQYVPDLSDIFSEGNENSSFTNIAGGDTERVGNLGKGRILLKELILKLKNSENLSPEVKHNLHKLILKDIKRIGEVDQEISAVAKFTALYVRAQLIYTNCINSSGWVQLATDSQTPAQYKAAKSQIEALLQICLKMQYIFTGLSPKEFGIIIQLKLRALALQLACIAHGSSGSALGPCQNLLEQAELVQAYLEQNNITPDDFTQALFLLLDSMESPKPGTLSSKFLPYFNKYPVQLMTFSSNIKMATTTIIDPSGDSDNALKFTAGLLLGIPFDAEIRNLNDTSNVRIKVKYPDDQVHLIQPRTTDFRTIADDEVRLLTSVNVSHNAWTEACPITLCVVLDLGGIETNFNARLVGKNDPVYTISLSEEKQVLVLPKPPKRGI